MPLGRLGLAQKVEIARLRHLPPPAAANVEETRQIEAGSPTSEPAAAAAPPNQCSRLPTAASPDIETRRPQQAFVEQTTPPIRCDD